MPKANELTKIKRSDVYTDSWVIAESIERRHKTIVQTILRYEHDLKELGTLFSSSGRGTKTRGQGRVIYDLNEQQAIFLLTLMDNSQKVIEFKKRLAQAFVKMKYSLLERQTLEWQNTRAQAKEVRLRETTEIKRLTELAKSQGSEHCDKIYIPYSKLIKELVGHESRDTATTDMLTRIMMLEQTLLGIISEEVSKETDYHDIYQIVKKELTKLNLLWSVSALPAPNAAVACLEGDLGDMGGNDSNV